jgi:glutamine synthetase adenylyltransferase
MSTDLYLEQLAIAVREGNESGIRVYYDLLRAAEETKRLTAVEQTKRLTAVEEEETKRLAIRLQYQFNLSNFDLINIQLGGLKRFWSSLFSSYSSALYTGQTKWPLGLHRRQDPL